MSAAKVVASFEAKLKAFFAAPSRRDNQQNWYYSNGVYCSINNVCDNIKNPHIANKLHAIMQHLSNYQSLLYELGFDSLDDIPNITHPSKEYTLYNNSLRYLFNTSIKNKYPDEVLYKLAFLLHRLDRILMD